ncbi:hypothetical protein GCM10011521_20190 [Arenimonas soli]|uniref:histidine kinase n=1 Tax=Arenimonas soli TaxID=2269504 RepID=A0ABQ1HL81_9GAMM|nr:hybrid sensor histidine kinase/response regulator [Arenimonas soli]GGA81804.1 hypothetical protein GCM10011521_20190 [Arenimonas soli]
MLLAVTALLGWQLSARSLARLRARHATEQAKQHAVVHRLGAEIRNALTAITGNCEALLYDGKTCERSRLLAMRDSSERLMALVRNAGAWLVPPTPVTGIAELQPMLQELVASRMSTAIGKGLHFELHVEPGAPDLLETDLAWLHAACANLIDHALAATGRGHVEVTLHAESGDELQLSVADTGPSLAPEAVARLFEPYGLDGILPGGNPPGTGLNLHVARSIARAFGGDIECATGTPGTVYTLRLPARLHSRSPGQPCNDAVVPFNDHYARHRSRVPRKRVLVAEDQASNAHVIIAALERGGHSAVLARDGDAALAQLQAGEPFDVAVVDLGLPGITGLDLIKLSRLDGRGGAALPFIVLTGDTSARMREACVAAGAWMFLNKPMSARRLLDAIAQVCERADRLPELAAVPVGTIRLDTAHRTLLDGDPSGALLENFRDVLNYRREMGVARQHDWRDALCRVRAVRGAAYLVGAERVVAACRRLLELPLPELPAAWPAFEVELDASIDDAWRSLSSLLAQAPTES